MSRILCEACEAGDHANCGMQTWCECECDPDSVWDFDPYGEMQWPDETNEEDWDQ